MSSHITRSDAKHPEAEEREQAIREHDSLPDLPTIEFQLEILIESKSDNGALICKPMEEPALSKIKDLLNITLTHLTSSSKAIKAIPLFFTTLIDKSRKRDRVSAHESFKEKFGTDPDSMDNLRTQVQRYLKNDLPKIIFADLDMATPPKMVSMYSEEMDLEEEDLDEADSMDEVESLDKDSRTLVWGRVCREGKNELYLSKELMEATVDGPPPTLSLATAEYLDEFHRLAFTNTFTHELIHTLMIELFPGLDLTPWINLWPVDPNTGKGESGMAFELQYYGYIFGMIFTDPKAEGDRMWREDTLAIARFDVSNSYERKKECVLDVETLKRLNIGIRKGEVWDLQNYSWPVLKQYTHHGNHIRFRASTAGEKEDKKGPLEGLGITWRCGKSLCN